MWPCNRTVLFSLCLFSITNSYAGLSPFVDVLYWNTSEETASIWANINTTPSSTVHHDLIENISFDWKPGLRGGFLYEPKSCFWDSRLYWTYFSTDKKYEYPAYGQALSPEFFSAFISLNPFFGATIDWRFALNMLDYNISHAFPIKDSITLRPSIGLKAGTIHQHIHAFWDADVYGATEKIKNNFAGIGPTFGMDLQWKIYKDFVLIGDFSSAFMWGNWKLRDTYNRPGALLGLVTPTTITTYLNNAKLGTLMLTYFLGLEWTYHGLTNVALQIGYEMQYWPNQLRLIAFQQLPTHGDLTLQGATCRVHIDL